MSQEKTENVRCAYCRAYKYYSRGQYREALELYRKALVVAKQAKDRKREGDTYAGIGVCHGSLGQHTEALGYFTMALNVAKDVGDTRGESTAYLHLGTIYHILRKYDEAVELYQKHLSIRKQVDGKATRAYLSLGQCYNGLWQHGDARKHFNMAIEIATRTGDDLSKIKAYVGLGSSHHSEMQYEKAKETYGIALSIAGRTGNEADKGDIYGKLGTMFYQSGQYAKATEQHEKQLSIAKQMGDKKCELHALHSLAMCSRAVGRYAEAIAQGEIHLALAKEIGDKIEEEKAHESLGSVYASIWQHDKAARHHELGLKIEEYLAGDVAHKLCSHTHLGNYYKTFKKFDKAIAHYKIALTVAIEMDNQLARGVANLNIGECYLSSGTELAKALEHFWLALLIARKIGDQNGAALAHEAVGGSLFYMGDYRKSIVHFLLVLNYTKEKQKNKWEIDVYYNLAECFMALEEYENAESNLRRCLQCLDNLLENLPDEDEFRVTAIDDVIEVYRRLIMALFFQHKVKDALVIAERGRARALTNLVTSNHPVPHGKAPTPKLLDFECISRVAKGLGSTVLFFTFLCHEICCWAIQPTGSVRFKKEWISVSTQAWCSHSCGFTPHVDDLISLIERAMSVLRLGCTRNFEDRSLAFLYPEATPAHSVMLTAEPTNPPVSPHTRFSLVDSCQRVTQHSQKSRLKSAGLTPAVAQVNSTHSSYGDGNSDSGDPLRELYQVILGQIGDSVEGPQVVVVPDGPLALVPYVALVDDNGRYLVESLQVRLVPSLATARIFLQQPAHNLRAQGYGPLIVGDPDVGKIQNANGEVVTVGRLPHANVEAKAVGEIFGVQPLTGQTATKKNFVEKLESANLIHIAAHGDMERGEILLAASSSDGGIPNLEDAMLTISDLEHKHLSAKLVVLSSCHSAWGKIRAEGVVGIARAFLGAGARAVLVTLWGIDDEATLNFMKKFYGGLVSGKKASESMSDAMKYLKESEEFSHPYYWAPFVLIGDDVCL